jgi:hypothetical protein
MQRRDSQRNEDKLKIPQRAIGLLHVAEYQRGRHSRERQPSKREGRTAKA